MKNRNMMMVIVIAAVISIFAGTVSAAPVYWTDWTGTLSTASGVVGTINDGSNSIGVTYIGPYSFALTSGGTNYWNPSAPYISADVDNAPPASDIIALGTGGTKTISFSQTVTDPLIALVSWNGNTVDFGVPIQVLSYGAGYFGNGTPVVNTGGTGFFGSGEVHGVIRLLGSFETITFTDTSENWHGFTVGLASTGEPPTGVPEPSTLFLLGAGLAGIAFIRRKSRG